MHPIAQIDIAKRLRRDNPWWDDPSYVAIEATLPKRVYFQKFLELALNFTVRRAAILLGPRRVGKTVMLKQLVSRAIESGIDPNDIMYVSIDAPVYLGMPLEAFLELRASMGVSFSPKIVIFDEIQYLKNWEVHLKDLVDSYSSVKFIASGSAAAALKLKSQESGAGRFSEFILPPLTFYEFLEFLGDGDLLEVDSDVEWRYITKDIDVLNRRFVDYLNWGGYPEAVVNDSIRRNADQFIRNDIIDKVLLKDLPSLYGIQDIQELNRLFAVLAYNAGAEISLEGLSQQSQIAKPTIAKYIQYLESAFLIIRVNCVDDNARHFQRVRNFKVYLSNPSMRAALFSPVEMGDHDKIGHLTECAIFAQWQHSAAIAHLRYARWRDGEVDIVYLNPGTEKADWIVEVKWSDRIVKDPYGVTQNIAKFIRNNPSVVSGGITSKTHSAEMEVEGISLNVTPAAIYCYGLGRNITSTEDRIKAIILRQGARQKS